MKEETAVELLKLAAQLAEQKMKASPTRKDQAEEVFNHSLSFLLAHLKELKKAVV